MAHKNFARNRKLTPQDVREYCEEHPVRIEVRDYGKRDDLPTIGIRIEGSFTPLPAECVEHVFAAVVNIMVARGVHAKLNS